MASVGSCFFQCLLDNNKISFKPAAKPTLSALFENLIGNVIAELALIPRLPDILTYIPAARGGETHYQVIGETC